jgi:hypothetical protein
MTQIEINNWESLRASIELMYYILYRTQVEKWECLQAIQTPVKCDFSIQSMRSTSADEVPTIGITKRERKLTVHTLRNTIIRHDSLRNTEKITTRDPFPH